MITVLLLGTELSDFFLAAANEETCGDFDAQAGRGEYGRNRLMYNLSYLLYSVDK